MDHLGWDATEVQILNDACLKFKRWTKNKLNLNFYYLTKYETISLCEPFEDQ